jgi:hypothetical protein
VAFELLALLDQIAARSHAAACFPSDPFLNTPRSTRY